jgi:hypothetical protein
MTTAAPRTTAHGLTCPNCSGVVPVHEGTRIVTCPFCEMRSLVQGDHGVRRWQVINQVARDQALKAVQGFFSGMNKARDLKQKSDIRELFLVYLPYWQVEAYVAGWMLGREKSGDSTKPVEVEIAEEMVWNDAATDVSEFGVHRVSATGRTLEPYDPERLRAEGMVFEPVESRDDALAEAQQYFRQRAQGKKRLHQKFFEKFHFLNQKLSTIYYPLWVARYEYRGRNYQVVVDGVDGQILYGKAPGNIIYRAAVLVGGMAAGNFILVNGTIIAGRILAESDNGDGWFLLAVPAAVGLGLIAAAYARFRHGEEVEQLQKGAAKAVSQVGEGQGLLRSAMSMLEQTTNVEYSQWTKFK